MNAQSRPPLVAWFVLAFATVQIRGLWTDWQHSPLDRLGWLALVLWLVPAVVGWVAHRGLTFDRLSTVLLISAGLSLLVGVVFELHVLAHLAFACATAAISRPSRFPWLWLIGAISWMPALTSISKELPVVAIISLRIFLAASSAIIGSLPPRRSPAPL